MTLVEEMVVLPYQPWKISAGELDTGVPLAIAGVLLAGGRHRRQGVHGAELTFEPAVFLQELARFGMSATQTITQPLSFTLPGNSSAQS